MKHGFHQQGNIRENHLIYLFKTLGENVKTWGRDTNEKYLAGAWRRGSGYESGVGLVAAPLATILELPDYVYAGVVDQHVTPPSGIAGRTRRDIGLLVKDVATFHPLRAGGDAFRLAFNDLPMDGIDLVGGFHTKGAGQRAQIMRDTRTNIARMEHASSEGRYALAA